MSTFCLLHINIGDSVAHMSYTMESYLKSYFLLYKFSDTKVTHAT